MGNAVPGSRCVLASPIVTRRRLSAAVVTRMATAAEQLARCDDGGRRSPASALSDIRPR
jgi:hypothetical protein